MTSESSNVDSLPRGVSAPQALPVDLFTVADASHFGDLQIHDLQEQKPAGLKPRFDEDRVDRIEIPDKLFPERDDLPPIPNTVGKVPVESPGPPFEPLSDRSEAINLFDAEPDLEIFVDLSESQVNKQPEVPDNTPLQPVTIVPPRRQTIGVATPEN